MKQIIITAGGTSEPIDRVRKITNSSTGKLGTLICEEILKKDKECIIYYIYSKNSILPENNNRIKLYPIVSTEDLEKTIIRILTTEKIDIFIHSMAVSDYTSNDLTTLESFSKMLFKNKSILNIDKEEEFLDKIKDIFDNSKQQFKKDNDSNKISSSYHNLILSFKQTAKIISLIKKINPHIFLVGFKLLDNVTEEELFEVGFNLLRKNKCNLVLANDLSLIKEGNHVGLLIYPEKKYDILKGKDNIAKGLIDAIYNRAFVKHPQSINISSENGLFDTELNDFRKIGKKLFDLGLLPEVINHERIDKIGTYGNMSIRDKFDINSFFITGRNVHKGKLEKDNLCYITRVNEINNNENIYCRALYSGVIKPSIDSAIHSSIYNITNFNAIVHIHTDKVFLGIKMNDYNYPCGSMEERDSIIKIIEENPNENIIQLYKHGLIIMGKSLYECQNKIEELFNDGLYIDYSNNYTPNEEFSKHVKEVNGENIISKGHLYAIKKGNYEIGVLFEDIQKEYINFAIYSYLKTQGKGHNIVRKIIDMYGEKTLRLHTMKGCNIKNFYINKFGFKIIEENNGQYILEK